MVVILLPSIIFPNKICVFIMTFTALSFYGLFTPYFSYEEAMSVRLYVRTQCNIYNGAFLQKSFIADVRITSKYASERHQHIEKLSNFLNFSLC